jgi:hypothetical protein
MQSASLTMETIERLEDAFFNQEGNLVVQAYLGGWGKQTVQQTLLDPPEYGPGLCEAVIDKDALPPGVNGNVTEEDLERLIDRCNRLDELVWYQLSEDNSDDLLD